jgi:hypothetical protein
MPLNFEKKKVNECFNNSGQLKIKVKVVEKTKPVSGKIFSGPQPAWHAGESVFIVR